MSTPPNTTPNTEESSVGDKAPATPPKPDSTVPETNESQADSSSDDSSGGDFIRYTAFGRRVITKDHWKDAGITGAKEDSVWDPKVNAGKIAKSKFNKEQLNYLLKVDGSFEESD